MKVIVPLSILTCFLVPLARGAAPPTQPVAEVADTAKAAPSELQGAAQAPATDEDVFDASRDEKWSVAAKTTQEPMSSEASMLAKLSKQTVQETLLPLVALAPVLAAAGFEAEVDNSTNTPTVRFPSMDFSVVVDPIRDQ